jgi:broad specificity phosphatase PhoE
MTKLCLIRHGQTDWNLEGRWQGHSDPPLNATGYDQARLVADNLTSRSFAAIYTSDLQRALATATIIADKLTLPLNIIAGLRELNMGDWEGKLVAEIPSLYPAEWAERQNNPVESRPPGGESVLELSKRVNSAISAICVENLPDDQLLIVSHGLSLAVFLCYVQKRPLAEAFTRIPHNANPTFLDWTPNQMVQ